MVSLQKWTSLRVMTIRRKIDILIEALNLTSGDRNNSYGPATQDFTRIAVMWTALFGHYFTPKDVAMAMICLKLSRESWMGKRDNWTDIAGYARLGNMCREVGE